MAGIISETGILKMTDRSNKAQEILKKYFGYDSFKSGQDEVIASILAGQDVLAVMPTGSGKSICYQVPALLLPGITLVISPLISLMHDQVKSLNDAGIHAGYINSSLTERQIAKVYDNAAKGIYKILYIAPERLESEEFLFFAHRAEISMVTVDEAHCISQWGQDFRISYLKIVDFVDGLSKRPLLSAFTATATEEVKTDIACVLKLQQPRLVTTGYDRANLFFEVEHTRQKDAYVLDFIKKHSDECGIIYCSTRKNVDALYDLLVSEEVSAARYHAGMSSEERKTSQDDFIYDRAQVIVATNAFGMGIDKSNVRYVLHYNMPQSMENYYQEAGRAGRDGESSRCILLFSAQDIMINKFLLEHKDFSEISEEDEELIRQRDMKRLQVMEGYCKTSGCLRNYILDYFERTAFGGDGMPGREGSYNRNISTAGASGTGIPTSDPSSGLRREPCGNCGNCQGDFSLSDMTAEAKQVINCVYETRGRYGLNVILGTLLGANRVRLKELGTTSYQTYGVLKEHSESELRELISQMVLSGYLYQTADKYSVIRMGNIAPLKDPETHVLIRTGNDHTAQQQKPFKKKSTDALTKAGYELFDRLRTLRLNLAREAGLPPYIIFGDKTLIDMSVKVPQSLEEMLFVSGVGEVKCKKYGERFLQEIAAFLKENPNGVTGFSENASAEEQFSGEPERFVKKGYGKKAPFRLNLKDAEQYQYRDLALVSEIRDELNRITTAENVKKVFGTDIFRVLTAKGYVREQAVEGRTQQVQTEAGLLKGILTTEQTSKNGNVYTVLRYPPEIQKEIVEYYTCVPNQLQKSQDSRTE